MKLSLWRARGLGIACLVLAAVLSSVGIAAFTARDAYAQTLTVNSIIVQGNQRVESDTIRSYFVRAQAAVWTRFRSMKA